MQHDDTIAPKDAAGAQWSAVDGFNTAAAQPFLEPVRLPAETPLVRRGVRSDACYVIDDGTVRIETARPTGEPNSIATLTGPGSICGALPFINGGVRAAPTVAHTEVRARRLTRDAFQQLRAQLPTTALAVMEALATSALDDARLLSEQMDSGTRCSTPDPSVEATVTRATRAQRAIEDIVACPEHRIDEVLLAIGHTIARQGDALAAATVAETGIGNIADKRTKIDFAARQVVSHMLTTPGVGFRGAPGGSGVTEFAAPIGVIFALTPVTNPASTIAFKTLIAIRSRNAVIFSSHRAAAGVAARTVALIRQALASAGCPVDLVQCLEGPGSRDRTARFMRHAGVGLILATGGPAVVNAAYSSGTPAIGVGSGNAPALVCADADLDAAASAIVASKSFDHGLICGSENHVVVESTVQRRFIAALRRAGATVLRGDDVDRLADAVFQHGRLRRGVVGQSAAAIASLAGVDVADDTRLLIASIERGSAEGPWGREKLAPILSLFTVRDADEGVEMCRTLLDGQGAGHTAVIHTTDRARQLRFTAAVPASRIIANGPGAHGCIGLGNGLTPSLTLGCGTFGGTSTSDNVTATHLLNIKRLATPRPARQPNPAQASMPDPPATASSPPWT